MAWYAYCLTELQTLSNGVRSRKPFLLEGVQGIGDAPVFGYPSGEFAVTVSEVERAATKLDQKTLVEHARVVSSCFRLGTVLPFRFGTIFENDEALRQSVRSNRRAFGQSVEKLRGKSEMHIKLVLRDGSLKNFLDDVELPNTVGGDYLSKLRVKASKERERHSKARSITVQVHKLFNPLEAEVSCRKVDATGMLLDIAHLIDTKSIAKYQNRYNMATRQFKNCDLVLSGPWPPYHFLPGKLRTGTGSS
jgi:hypothetical protein